MTTKSTVADWSTTPVDNDNIADIPLGENLMYAHHVNDAFRNVMAQVKAAVGGTAVSTFMQTMLDDANASTALTTLGVSTFIKTLLDDASAAAARTTLGSTTVGDAVFIAANAGAAQTAIGVSTFVKTLLDDADASTARTTLGAMGGSTGSTDNILLRSDGTGAATVQNSAITVDDSGNTSGIGTLAASGAVTGLSFATSNGLFSGGSIGLGTFSATGATNGRLSDNGSNYTQRSSATSTGSINHYSLYNPNGNVGNISTSASATVYATSSDYRLKTDVTPLVEFTLSAEWAAALPDDLLTLMGASPVAFHWKVNPGAPLTHGFIAHELQAVYSDAVSGIKDAVEDIGTATTGETSVENVTRELAPPGSTWVKTGEQPVYQGVDASFLVPDLVASVQQLTLMVLAQGDRIAALEAK